MDGVASFNLRKEIENKIDNFYSFSRNLEATTSKTSLKSLFTKYNLPSTVITEDCSFKELKVHVQKVTKAAEINRSDNTECMTASRSRRRNSRTDSVNRSNLGRRSREEGITASSEKGAKGRLNLSLCEDIVGGVDAKELAAKYKKKLVSKAKKEEDKARKQKKERIQASTLKQLAREESLRKAQKVSCLMDPQAEFQNKQPLPTITEEYEFEVDEVNEEDEFELDEVNEEDEDEVDQVNEEDADEYECQHAWPINPVDNKSRHKKKKGKIAIHSPDVMRRQYKILKRENRDLRQQVKKLLKYYEKDAGKKKKKRPKVQYSSSSGGASDSSVSSVPRPAKAAKRKRDKAEAIEKPRKRMTVTSVGSLMKYVQEVALQCKSGNGTGESGPDDFVEQARLLGKNKTTAKRAIDSYLVLKYGQDSRSWFERMGDKNTKVDDLMHLVYDSMVRGFNHRKKKNKYKSNKGFTSIEIPAKKILVSKKADFLKLLCRVKHRAFIEDSCFDETTFKGIRRLMEQETLALDFREGRYPRGEMQDVKVFKVTYQNATKADALSEVSHSSGDDSGDEPGNESVED